MNIYVGNLLFDVTEDDVRKLFEQFGQVTEARLVMSKIEGKSKGFGFIEMPEKEEALKAIKEINDSEFMGRSIKASQAKQRDSRGRKLGRNQRRRGFNSRSGPGRSGPGRSDRFGSQPGRDRFGGGRNRLGANRTDFRGGGNRSGNRSGNR